MFHFYHSFLCKDLFTHKYSMTLTVCGPCLWGHSICSYTLCSFIPMLVVPAVSVYTVTSFIFSSSQNPQSLYLILFCACACFLFFRSLLSTCSQCHFLSVLLDSDFWAACNNIWIPSVLLDLAAFFTFTYSYSISRLNVFHCPILHSLNQTCAHNRFNERFKPCSKT